jgi:hypothetical protein
MQGSCVWRRLKWEKLSRSGVLVSKAIAAATGTVRLATVFIFLREAVTCSETVHTTYENIDGRYMYSSIHSSEIFLFSFCPILRT